MEIPLNVVRSVVYVQVQTQSDLSGRSNTCIHVYPYVRNIFGIYLCLNQRNNNVIHSKCNSFN